MPSINIPKSQKPPTQDQVQKLQAALMDFKVSSNIVREHFD